ncbi:MAG TPA: MFS transporter [Actinomycetota bacterium]|nr:MFS transporter [Actinomycetota bacterium]
MLGAQFSAQAADGVTQAALADAIVLEPLRQGTPERILGLFALTLLPYSVVSPFLGVLVDRLSRHRILVGTNLCRAVLLAGVPLWAPRLPGDTGLYAAMLLLLGLGRLFLTTKGAVLPGVVMERRLVRANSVSSGGGMVSALLGGVSGVALSGLLGPLGAIGTAGALYLLPAAIASRIDLPCRPPSPHGTWGAALARVVVELRHGLNHVARAPGARLGLASIFVLRTLAMFVAIAAVLLIKQHFPGAEERVGRLSHSALALGLAGLGAFAGAASAPMLERRLDEARMVVFGYLVSALALLALGSIAGVGSLLVLMAVGGFGSFLTKVAVDALVQESLPDEYRGRAFALYDILYNAASVVAGAVIVLTWGASVEALLLATGGATLFFGLVFALALRSSGLLAGGAFRPRQTA